MRHRPAHVRFVATVRLRMIARQVVDAAVFGILAGIVAAAIAGRFAISVSVGLVPAFGIAMAYLITHWPTSAAAAKLIDTQLGWNELLQSARASGRDANADHLGRAVETMADTKCNAADPSALKLGRLSSRRAIGVIVVLLVSAAIWVAPQGSSESTPSQEGADRSAVSPDEVANVASPAAGRRVNAPQTTEEQSLTVGSVVASHAAAMITGPSAHRGTLAGGAGAGSAEASGATAATVVASASPVNPPRAGETIGGDGAGAMERAGDHGVNRGVVIQNSSGAPPSNISDYGGGEPAEGAETTRSNVVDRDRDLVRAFFDR